MKPGEKQDLLRTIMGLWWIENLGLNRKIVVDGMIIEVYDYKFHNLDENWVASDKIPPPEYNITYALGPNHRDG